MIQRVLTAFSGATISQPDALFTNIASYHNLNCFNDSSGSIETAASGGAPPYSFLWTNSSTYENIYGLQPGSYTLTVTDANHCNTTISQSITQPTQLADSISGTNVSCAGAANGLVSYGITGGTPPYSYVWINGSTSQNLVNIPGGVYLVLAQDAKGCHISDSIRIYEAPPIIISGQANNTRCYNTNTGSVNISISGGVSPYSYLWSTGATTGNLVSVVSGTYSVTVTDSAGCAKAASFNVGEATEIVANLATISPACHGANTGAVIAVVTGGNPPYTYNWNTIPVGTASSINNLGDGSYTVNITDTTGCQAQATAVLRQTDSIIVSTNINGSKCFNTSTGSVIAHVSGGIPPYTYLVNGIQYVVDSFTNLAPGPHTVLVIDANGCQATSPFIVSSPAQLSVKLTASEQSILTGMQTQLTATVNSDTGILAYFWNPDSLISYVNCSDPADCNNPLAAPKTTTTFMVTVENADSCYASDTITIAVVNQAVSFIPTAFTPNGDGLNDHFQFTILGANTIEVTIFNRWGERVYYNSDQSNNIGGTDGWDGTIGGKPAPDDSYVYQLKVTYFDNTVQTKTGTVTIMR